MIEEGFSLISALGDSNFLPGFLKHASPFNEALIENFEVVDLLVAPTPSAVEIFDLVNQNNVPIQPTWMSAMESDIVVETDQIHWQYLNELNDYTQKLKNEVDSIIAALQDTKDPQLQQFRDELKALRPKLNGIESEIREITRDVETGEDIKLSREEMFDKGKEFSDRLRSVIGEVSENLKLPNPQYHHTESSMFLNSPMSDPELPYGKFPEDGDSDRSKTENFPKSFPGARFLEELFSPFSKRNS